LQGRQGSRVARRRCRAGTPAPSKRQNNTGGVGGGKGGGERGGGGGEGPNLGVGGPAGGGSAGALCRGLWGGAGGESNARARRLLGSASSSQWLPAFRSLALGKAWASGSSWTITPESVSSTGTAEASAKQSSTW